MADLTDKELAVLKQLHDGVIRPVRPMAERTGLDPDLVRTALQGLKTKGLVESRALDKWKITYDGKAALQPSNMREALAGSVVVTGGRNVAIGTGGEVISRDITLTPEGDQRVLSEDQAFQRIGATARSNLTQLEQNVAQARTQANQFFMLTLVFAGLGFLVVLVGVALLLAGQVAAGIVSSVASIVPEVTALLFFRKDKELRSTIEQHHQRIADEQRTMTMIDVAETVKDGNARDSLKRQIIHKALGIAT